MFFVHARLFPDRLIFLKFYLTPLTRTREDFFQTPAKKSGQLLPQPFQDLLDPLVGLLRRAQSREPRHLFQRQALLKAETYQEALGLGQPRQGLLERGALLVDRGQDFRVGLWSRNLRGPYLALARWVFCQGFRARPAEAQQPEVPRRERAVKPGQAFFRFRARQVRKALP